MQNMVYQFYNWFTNLKHFLWSHLAALSSLVGDKTGNNLLRILKPHLIYFSPAIVELISVLKKLMGWNTSLTLAFFLAPLPPSVFEYLWVELQ